MSGAVGAVELTLPEEVIEDLVRRVAAEVVAQLDSPGADGWLDSRAAAEYLGLPSVNALYKLSSVPFEQDAPGGKLWFKRSELDTWRGGE